MSGSERRLGVQLSVISRESTRWTTHPIPGYPGKVVLAAAGTDALVDIHLDRVAITRMQSALEGALAALERELPAA